MVHTQKKRKATAKADSIDIQSRIRLMQMLLTILGKSITAILVPRTLHIYLLYDAMSVVISIFALLAFQTDVRFGITKEHILIV
jgi:hypothetical protein